MISLVTDDYVLNFHQDIEIFNEIHVLYIF